MKKDEKNAFFSFFSGTFSDGDTTFWLKSFLHVFFIFDKHAFFSNIFSLDVFFAIFGSKTCFGHFSKPVFEPFFQVLSVWEFDAGSPMVFDHFGQTGQDPSKSGQKPGFLGTRKTGFSRFCMVFMRFFDFARGQKVAILAILVILVNLGDF